MPTSLPSQDDSPASRPPAYRRPLMLQAAAAFTVLSLAWPYFVWRNEPLPWPETALAIGIVGLLLSSLTREPWWWRIIHTVFAPLSCAVAALSIDPGWFLLAAIAVLLVYRGALSGQIPLFLSNAKTVRHLQELPDLGPGRRLIDLGAGLGSLACPLAQARPDISVSGVENAPAAWLVGRLRSARLKNCHWRWGDLWRVDLSDYDLVYAFLSPTPMAALWQKACREMPAGSLFVSNSFPVPGIEADEVVEVDDARQTRLFLYRPPGSAVKQA